MPRPDIQYTIGARDATREAFGSINRSIQTAKTAFRGLATFFAAREILQFTKAAFDAAEKLDNLGKQTDFSVERIQRLQFAYGQTGLAGDQLSDALQRLNRRFGLFRTSGGGPAAAAIKQLGLEQDITSGKIESAEQLYDAAIRKLGQMSSAADVAAIASQLFGEDQGPKLAAAISQGTDALAEQEAALGKVISREQVTKADALNDAFKSMATTIKNNLYSALIDAGGALADFFDIESYKRRGTLEEQLQRTQTTIAELRRQIERAPSGIARVASENKLVEALAEEARLQGLIAEQERKRDEEKAKRAAALAQFGEPLPTIPQKILKTQLDDLSEYKLELVDVEGAVGRIQDRFERLGRVQNENSGIYASIRDANKELEGFNKSSDQVLTLWEDIGRGLQTTLADAFRGVNTSFTELLRNMAAEFAASSVLRLLFGGLAQSSSPFAAIGKALLPGFATGGSFTVGGSGGIDSQVVAFRATPGEQVQIGQPGQKAINVVVHNHFDVGLESVEDRIQAAVPQIASATASTVIGQLRRPRMA